MEFCMERMENGRENIAGMILRQQAGYGRGLRERSV